MTVPFWCLFAGVLLPYVWATARLPYLKELGGPDSKEPRAQGCQADREGRSGSRRTGECLGGTRDLRASRYRQSPGRGRRRLGRGSLSDLGRRPSSTRHFLYQ